MTADELRAATVAALEGVADQLPEAPPGEKPAPGDWLVVRGNAHVGGCPAATALTGDTEFDANPITVAWELAKQAGDRLVHGSTDPRSAKAPATPADALALAVEEEGDNWALEWWAAAGGEERALAQAAVTRRLAGIVRLAKVWPPPGRVRCGHKPKWPFPGRPLRLEGRVDLVVGQPGHDHTLVVSLNGDHGPDTRARLAYEALVEALALRRPPARVVGLLPDAGRRWTVTVDDAVLAEGVEAAAGAARTALGQRRRDATGLDRRPGPRCRWCEHAAACPAGTSWLAGPGRLRSGFLPTG